MRIDAVNIKKENILIADYRKGEERAMQFFDYQPFESLKDRAIELNKRNFKREELTKVLLKSNQKWGASSSTLENIELLKQKETIAIVGGQQAGLLTGPLYSINKVISIIQFAKQQEEELQVPVVPIFWIAGEDHDYEEINHVYMPDKTELKKMKLKQSLYKKAPISQVELDKEICEKWLQDLFLQLDETKYSKELFEMLKKHLQHSSSFTDFFAKIIFEIFQEEGIILIDSADENVRALESEYFIQLIENQQKISNEVVEACSQLKEYNYPIHLDAALEDGHLFYHLDGERILLERDADGKWIGKQNEIMLTTNELLTVAKESPAKLSNNVVTRPLMQEMLLPTLAFIGGPGEISYWAALKKAFHTLDLNMPPVIPRLSYTFLTDKVNKALEMTKINVETAVNEGVSEQRKTWLESKQSPDIAELAEVLKQTIDKAHQPMREVASEIRDDVKQLSEKNLEYIHREVDFLRDRMMQALEFKFEKELSQFDLIQQSLRPEDGLQERKWNPLPFLNRYGNGYLANVINHPVSFKENHYVVYL
ncbi:bacillithiol biosynthesis cysteine-adding enzyme BshC [Oceanobacillus sp. CAU 1775]